VCQEGSALLKRVPAYVLDRLTCASGGRGIRATHTAVSALIELNSPTNNLSRCIRTRLLRSAHPLILSRSQTLRSGNFPLLLPAPRIANLPLDFFKKGKIFMRYTVTTFKVRLEVCDVGVSPLRDHRHPYTSPLLVVCAPAARPSFNRRFANFSKPRSLTTACWEQACSCRRLDQSRLNSASCERSPTSRSAMPSMNRRCSKRGRRRAGR
jgi:hypothetical protein